VQRQAAHLSKRAGAVAYTVPKYAELAYRDGRALVFEALLAMGEDWTAFFKHFNNTHAIVVTFDADNDWCALYTLVGPSFC
uniref:Uncharacterized protein n=1 Tax=Romanomermis culicivorax TaxID=13658 RepID=A0A915LAV6_ROMCU